MTVELLRRYLDRLREPLLEQELLQNRLEHLQDQAKSPRRSQLTGMPGTRSPSDLTGTLAARITDTEARLAELSGEIEAITDEIVAVLDRMPPATKRNHRLQEAALWGKYVETMTVRELVQSLYGKRADFVDHRDSYTRQTSRQVLEGLKRLASVVPDEDLETETQWEETNH